MFSVEQFRLIGSTQPRRGRCFLQIGVVRCIHERHMQFVLTAHARQRMRERKLTRVMLEVALSKPVRTTRENSGKLFIIALHYRNGRERALLIAGVMEGTVLKIFTVIETTKVQKYL
mgnify:CR=1 FL=1